MADCSMKFPHRPKNGGNRCPERVRLRQLRQYNGESTIAGQLFRSLFRKPVPAPVHTRQPEQRRSVPARRNALHGTGVSNCLQTNETRDQGTSTGCRGSDHRRCVPRDSVWQSLRQRSMSVCPWTSHGRPASALSGPASESHWNRRWNRDGQPNSATPGVIGLLCPVSVGLRINGSLPTQAAPDLFSRGLASVHELPDGFPWNLPPWYRIPVPGPVI